MRYLLGIFLVFFVLLSYLNADNNADNANNSSNKLTTQSTQATQAVQTTQSLQSTQPLVAQLQDNTQSRAFGTDLEPYPRSLGLGYTHSFMQANSFSISTVGLALQYTRSAPKYRGIYQLHFSHSQLSPTHSTKQATQNIAQEALHIGLFSAFDIGFANSEKGGVLLGVEGGIGSGIASQANNAFDESSLLLNADIGYVLKLGSFRASLQNLLIYPYLRVEQYIFLPHSKLSEDRFDYGLNGILGVKFIGDFRRIDWWVNIGLLSDFNCSGNGIGVLGDNSIIYDKDGISNGFLSDIGLNLLNNRAFALQARLSLNYALNYYELNIKGSLVGVWQF